VSLLFKLRLRNIILRNNIYIFCVISLIHIVYFCRFVSYLNCGFSRFVFYIIYRFRSGGLRFVSRVSFLVCILLFYIIQLD